MSDADSIAGYIDEFLHSTMAIPISTNLVVLVDFPTVETIDSEATSLPPPRTFAFSTMLAQARKKTKNVIVECYNMLYRYVKSLDDTMVTTTY